MRTIFAAGLALAMLAIPVAASARGEQHRHLGGHGGGHGFHHGGFHGGRHRGFGRPGYGYDGGYHHHRRHHIIGRILRSL